MSDGYSVRWFEEETCWKRREKNNKDASWKMMELPNSKNSLREEVVVAAIKKCSIPNYQRQTLDKAGQLIEQDNKTCGAAHSPYSYQDKFDRHEARIVYWIKKNKKEQVKSDSAGINHVVKLRVINETKPNNLYYTLIVKELTNRKLGAYDRAAIDAKLNELEQELKESELWDKYGWSKELPPSNKKEKAEMNFGAWIGSLKLNEEAKKNK